MDRSVEATNIFNKDLRMKELTIAPERLRMCYLKTAFLVVHIGERSSHIAGRRALLVLFPLLGPDRKRIRSSRKQSMAAHMHVTPECVEFILYRFLSSHD